MSEYMFDPTDSEGAMRHINDLQAEVERLRQSLGHLRIIIDSTLDDSKLDGGAEETCDVCGKPRGGESHPACMQVRADKELDEIRRHAHDRIGTEGGG